MVLPEKNEAIFVPLIGIPGEDGLGLRGGESTQN